MQAITVQDYYNLLVNNWRKKILSPMKPANKFVEVNPENYGWDNNVLREDCLKKLDIIDRFSREVLSRHTVTFNDFAMRVYINDPTSTNNAFWHTVPPQQKFWGNQDAFVSVAVTDPDKHNFHWATNLDILSHEFGHSIVAWSAKYEFNYQPGALDESFADIFAIMVHHFHTKTVAEDPNADWCMMQGFKRDEVPGAMRRIDLGPAYIGDNHPRHMNNYIHSQPDEDGDWGGRHWNSTIPGNAFWRVATGLGGPSYERAGNIWLNSIWNGKPTDNFEIFARRTIQSAKDLHYGSQIVNVVNKAWWDVGIDLRMPTVPEPTTEDLLSYLMAKRPLN